MPIKEDFFTTEDGTKIHYMTTGDRGSWIVLLSGFTDTAERMFFATGMAAALEANHRVVAYDHRNHGKSDRPEPGQMGRPEDAIELMDHLGIDKAHIYGYSMGGGFTGTLLAKYPQRFITAAFGGSGIWEYDQKEHDHASAMDKALAGRSPKSGESRQPAGPPRGAAGRSLPGHDETYTGNEHPLAPVPASRPHSRTPIDLYTVDIPIFAINGSLDTPFVKTQRMFRELRDFTSVILENHNHVSAIGIGNPMPQMHIDSLLRFIDANDS